ncbi:asparagine synthase-related protein [Staphylococcus haemolyticus]|uniref:asparagine synthase-related protein n=1 Tax=Staphylococcus haemolyticus TaxID=1283 RepID=UPI0034DDC021
MLYGLFTFTQLYGLYLIFKNNNDISFEDRLRTFGMNHLEADALVRIDLGLMNSSVEARVPLLNQRLVQFALSSQSMTSKQLIRDIGASLLPHEIYKRKKRGFPHPVYLWLQNSILRDYCYNSLKNSSISYLFNLKKFLIFYIIIVNLKIKKMRLLIIPRLRLFGIYSLLLYGMTN